MSELLTGGAKRKREDFRSTAKAAGSIKARTHSSTSTHRRAQGQRASHKAAEERNYISWGKWFL